MAKEFTAQGLKRPNYFENFKLSKNEKTGDGPKTEQKSFSLADMLNAPIPTNYIFVVPRQGGLVCMVLVGTIFKELKTTLETAVPALKPDENGVMSETFSGNGDSLRVWLPFEQLRPFHREHLPDLDYHGHAYLLLQSEGGEGTA